MYLEHFGLNEAPFRITPHTDFFYTGANRGALLDALLYAIGNDEGIVKVSGEIGTGKTMLARMAIRLLPTSTLAIYLANPLLNRDELLHLLADELGLETRDDQTHRLMRQIEERLVALYASNQKVALLIDEAHAMPVESLEAIRLLSNLESERHKLLQIVLFGQPELDSLLSKSNLRQLKDRITQNFRLGPMQLNDAAEYIDFRMRAAGYRGPRVFTPEAIKLIVELSSGLTRRINILADKGLLAAFANNEHVVDVAQIKRAAADAEMTSSPGIRIATPSMSFAWLSAPFRWLTDAFHWLGHQNRNMVLAEIGLALLVCVVLYFTGQPHTTPQNTASEPASATETSAENNSPPVATTAPTSTTTNGAATPVAPAASAPAAKPTPTPTPAPTASTSPAPVSQAAPSVASAPSKPVEVKPAASSQPPTTSTVTAKVADAAAQKAAAISIQSPSASGGNTVSITPSTPTKPVIIASASTPSTPTTPTAPTISTAPAPAKPAATIAAPQPAGATPPPITQAKPAPTTTAAAPVVSTAPAAEAVPNKATAAEAPAVNLGRLTRSRQDGTSAWLAASAAESWTLQLAVLDAKQSNAAEEVVAEAMSRQTGNQVHVRVLQGKNGARIQMLYGTYPDQASAAQAASTLPSELRRYKPQAIPLSQMR